MEPLDKL